MKVPVPVASELIVNELARLADGERNESAGWCARWHVAGKWEQITVRGTAKLIALEGQQRSRYGINIGHSQIGCQGSFCGRAGTTISGGHVRNESADKRPRRIAATLPRSLVVDKEKSQLAPGNDRSAQATAENVLLDDGSRRSALVEEVLICVQNRVAEEFVCVSVEGVRP